MTKTILQVKLEEHQQERISEIAENTNLPKSQIVRWAVDSFIELVDSKTDKLPDPILMIRAVTK
mgnify:CR=1 FL=1